MKKQFVTYEIALKLKELGFDEPCFGRYEQPDWKDIKLEITNTSFQNVFSWQLASAPLWQQCVDWLETKGYYINFTRVFQWSPLPIEFSGWCIYIGTENPEEQLECNSYYVRHYYPTKQEAREQAILKAIELCQIKK